MGRLIPLLALAVALGCVRPTAVHAVEPPDQLLLALAPTTEATHGTLRRFERDSPQSSWREVGQAVPILFGKNGLAWGRGLHDPQPGPQKQLGDGRAPAGRFLIGPILGDAPRLPEGAKWTDYIQKTDRVAWIDDPALPVPYNHAYILREGEETPPWFEGQRMRLGDPAHEWEITIEHNYDDPVPSAGNAIFFHVERGTDRPSFGCTVMTRDDLRELVTWLDPKAHPQLVQLAESDYERLWKDWDLPGPGALAAPAPAPAPVSPTPAPAPIAP